MRLDMSVQPFLILSSQHAGTHFLREALSSPASLVWNEWHPMNRQKNCATSCHVTSPELPLVRRTHMPRDG